MTTNVFLVWSRESNVPVTILAPSADEAALMFREWAMTHMATWTKEPSRPEEVNAEWLADRPQLMEAVQWAKDEAVPEAVLIFMNHQDGWAAVPTIASAIGAIAPPEPAVRCFETDVDADADSDLDVDEAEWAVGGSVLLFGYDLEHAQRLYKQWREAFHGPYDRLAKIKPFSRWLLTGDQTVLREQMDMGFVGLAGWSPDRGWSIYPPDHEMAGE